ncbi:MAG: hypothetical protein JJT78_16295 [Leptospira sp.]|nr:hypothetical protein [Leptospira sp.]
MLKQTGKEKKYNSNQNHYLSKSISVNLLARNASEEAILLFADFKTAANILVTSSANESEHPNARSYHICLAPPFANGKLLNLFSP